MNVYPCWHSGINGYCCRIHNSKWMFIPELGQIDSRIHKQLTLQELVFDNPIAQQHELRLELGRINIKSRTFNFLKSLFLSENKPNTVGGMLFATS